MEKVNGFRVVVGEYKNKEYRHEIGVSGTLRMAKRVESGVNINLNHSEFYTFIEQVENGEVVNVIEEDY